jgi:hypothetical protein
VVRKCYCDECVGSVAEQAKEASNQTADWPLPEVLKNERSWMTARLYTKTLGGIPQRRIARRFCGRSVAWGSCMPHHASQALDMRLTGAGIGWRKAEDWLRMPPVPLTAAFICYGRGDLMQLYQYACLIMQVRRHMCN